MPKPRKAFGQHTNAEISSSLADTDVLMQTMIEVRGGGKKYEVLFGLVSGFGSTKILTMHKLINRDLYR